MNASDTVNSLKPRFDLGVLFVHGIGRHQTGDTLVRFGEPIIKWIGRWCSGAAYAEHGRKEEHVRDALPEAEVADEFIAEPTSPVVMVEMVARDYACWACPSRGRDCWCGSGCIVVRPVSLGRLPPHLRRHA